MRPREDELIDPEILEQLDAIDATLAGEPVAPRFADLAELALLVAAERPEGPSAEFGASLDRRMADRFGRGGSGGRVGGPAGASGAASGAAGPGRRGRSWSSFGLMPALGLGVTAVVAVVVAVSVLGSGGSGPRVRPGTPALFGSESVASAGAGVKAPSRASATKAAGPSAGAYSAPGAKQAPSAATPAGGTAAGHSPAPIPPASSSAGGTTAGHSAAPALAHSRSPVTATTPTTASPPALGPINAPLQSAASAAPAPLPNGRRIVQSSILDLGTPARRMDAVAQEVFTVVRSVNAIVQSSNVSSTGGTGASAEFQLRVPSQNLSEALNALSRLRYANVVSRTDNTTDVNNSYLSLQRQITAAETALARLRVKLAAATTDSEIAILHAQIAVKQAALARLQGSLGSLSRQISFSNLYVSVQATAGTGGSHAGGFGLHQAGHDALRVLEVAAGVALIALAALLPLALLVALAWWLAAAAQRRRRERALDMA